MVVAPRPRIGSFDITLQPYHSAYTQEVFSKTSRLNFPSHSEVLEHLSSLLIPDTVLFMTPAKIHIRLIDSFYRYVGGVE